MGRKRLYATEEIAMKGSWKITAELSGVSLQAAVVCLEITSEEIVERHLTCLCFYPIRYYWFILTICIGMNLLPYFNWA